MIEKRGNQIRIFDSHGSCTGFNGNYGAYYAILENTQRAADFLAQHRNLETQHGRETQVGYYPLRIGQ